MDEDLLASLTRRIEVGEGAERAWAFRNRALLQGGYYTSDELIGMALEVGFTLSDPLIRVRRGTVIGRGAALLDGTTIEGVGVKIAEGAVLSRAVITGSNVSIGPGTHVTGAFAVDNVVTGDANHIEDLRGENTDLLRIGANNRIRGVTVANPAKNRISIGDDNNLHPGLALNAPFPGFGVTIGHRNQLGRDGGGVVSSSYRFNMRWGGPIVIGSHIETTRGAEILGYTLIGFSSSALEALCGMAEAAIAGTFLHGPLQDLDPIFQRAAAAMPAENTWSDEGPVSLYGTVKTKRCCVCPRTAIKDDTRLFCAYVKRAHIPERCKVFYSSISPPDGTALSISAQDIAIVRAEIREERNWGSFPTTADVDDYPATDESYFASRRPAP
jgi:hypothetical protein